MRNVISVAAVHILASVLVVAGNYYAQSAAGHASAGSISTPKPLLKGGAIGRNLPLCWHLYPDRSPRDRTCI